MKLVIIPLVISLITLSISALSFRPWKFINNKHWQIESSSVIAPLIDLSNGTCLPGMVHVRGQMKQDPDPNPYAYKTIEELQKTTCLKWINKDYPERCAAFDKDKWMAMSSKFDTKPMNFCMDQFEYPNQKGQYPLIFIQFPEAQQLCQDQGKRLCSETEWTFACEGEEALPYPYGYVRDDSICVIDKPFIAFSEKNMYPRHQASIELDKLWQGETSGSRPLCKSPFGVYDLTGNVDEWTVKDRREGKYKSILKGGYWGRVRTRCRPSTRNHGEGHIFYQQGFRCCSDSR
jgi:formylglycine-generating enzyme